MKILTPDANVALSNETVPIIQLVALMFATPVYLNTSNWDLEWAGITYKGAYGMGSISSVDDSPGEIKGLQFDLSGDSADLIALALDDAKVWQGTVVILRAAILNSVYQIVDAPVVWSGKGDTMNLQEVDGATTIQATAESSAVDLMRGHTLMYNNDDQLRLFPGDLGMNLMVSQVDQPVVWPAKSWYYK